MSGRPLTQNEALLVHQLFAGSLDPSKLRIENYVPNPQGAYGAPATAYGGTAYFDPKHYSSDFTQASAYEKATFVHEMVHLWQESNGVNIKLHAVGLFIRYGFDYQESYKYTIVPGKSFSTYNIEQQGAMVEDYFYYKAFGVPNPGSKGTGSLSELLAVIPEDIANGVGLNTDPPDLDLKSPNGLYCFTAGTMISMADGSEKPIEQIKPSDMVMAFDEKADNGRGELKPSRVVRTFTNTRDNVIDFHGTGVTAGHAYLCGDGPHAGKFRPIMDIIRDDGAVVEKSGKLIRAATNCEVGSRGDQFVKIDLMRELTLKGTGQPVPVVMEEGQVRAGTRMINPDGTSNSLLEMIDNAKWQLQEDGLVIHAPGQVARPLGYAGPKIPKPEDYILARSKMTLTDLYDDQRVAAPTGYVPPQTSQGNRKDRRRATAVRRHAGMTIQ